MAERKCINCGRNDTCEYAKHIENYRLKDVCYNYIPETITADLSRVGQPILPTYEEFVAPVGFLTPEDQLEWFKIIERYINKRQTEWGTKYTYCAGDCHKIVERDKAVAEEKDDKILIRCGYCNTVWYVRDKDE